MQNCPIESYTCHARFVLLAVCNKNPRKDSRQMLRSEIGTEHAGNTLRLSSHVCLHGVTGGRLLPTSRLPRTSISSESCVWWLMCLHGVTEGRLLPPPRLPRKSFIGSSANRHENLLLSRAQWGEGFLRNDPFISTLKDPQAAVKIPLEGHEKPFKRNCKGLLRPFYRPSHGLLKLK